VHKQDREGGWGEIERERKWLL